MKYITYITISILCLSHLWAENVDKDKLESLTGLKGTYNEKEKVFRVSFPRTDIQISVDNVQLDPFMGLTSWTAFTPIGESDFMVMGDLVLFQDEVNPVMSTLLNHNIGVTALHNH